MNVINCSKCGKIFNSVFGFPKCPACMQEEDKIFRKVKDYLYEQPGASVEEVALAVGLDQNQILVFLREGRLETLDGANTLRCAHCGIPISSGRYCSGCKSEMSKEFKSVTQNVQSEATNTKNAKGMHHLKKKK